MTIAEFVTMPVFVGRDDDKVVHDGLVQLIDAYQLPLMLNLQTISDNKPKSLKMALSALCVNADSSRAFLLEKGRLFLCNYHNALLSKTTLDWTAQTRRVVSAGRKSELILQACKLTTGMKVVDGTAGFGHDSLILASTGASVVMLESNPVMALMLLAEHHYMQHNKNWHGLLARLSIRYGDVTAYADVCDVVYLDPMFPKDSYDAKVNKNMQALHAFVPPPSLEDECQLLSHAKSLVQSNTDGRVVVKRPLGAPYLANHPPIQSWQNDALRFDRY